MISGDLFENYFTSRLMNDVKRIVFRIQESRSSLVPDHRVDAMTALRDLQLQAQ